MLTERDLEELDPLRIDREIAITARTLRKQLRREATGDFEAADPFLRGRLVAGKTAFTAIRALPASDPLRTPLAAWVYRLADHRINAEARMRVAAELHVARHVVSEPERDETTLGVILSRALSDEKRREAWLGSFLGKAGELGTAVAVLWERRQETAARLGLRGPSEISGVGADVVRAADAWLERTDGALFEITEPNLPSLLHVALSDRAAEGWPRHLTPRAVQDLLADMDLFRSVDLDPGALPALSAPASFPRALARVGAAWVDAMAPSDQPFVVANDPYGLRRRTFGALLGRLPGSPAFARRVLGLSGTRLEDHVRALAGAFLVSSRLAALRVLLGEAALAGRRSFREAFESGTHRALGVALPPSAAGAFVRLHEDDAQRFSGSLLAALEAATLRDLNDEDWYRNPKTTERFRDEARLSPVCTTTDDALGRGADALYAALAPSL